MKPWDGWVHCKHCQDNSAPTAVASHLSSQYLIASLFGVLLVADFMFFNSRHFIFDPDLKNYARKASYD